MPNEVAVPLQGLVAAILGGAVGGGELVSRYRDDPVDALAPHAAKVYIFVNALASAGTFTLIHVFGWTFGVEGSVEVQAMQLLVAAFGSMALLRTSLFTVRAGDQDIGIGPNALLTSILAAADRVVDRERAEVRATQVRELMGNISFEKTYVELPALCLALMQNVSPAEQKDVAGAVREIREMKASDELRSLTLGLALLNVVGDEVLREAVTTLGDRATR